MSGPVRRLFVAASLAVLLVLVPLALAGPGLPPQATAAPNDPTTWACGAEDLGLEEVSVQLAPVSPEESEQDGSPIRPQAGPDGGWVPVVLIHGWTARANHPDTDGAAGTFSHFIDLTWRLGVPQPNVSRSMVGQLQGLPGAAVFTYDYHPYSGRWVTDEHIGPGLAATIECLGQQSGNQVVVIGHSMGGLAIRQALAQAGVSEHVAAAITVGTPHSGSLGALIAAMVLEGAQYPGPIPNGSLRLLSALITYCSDPSTENFEAGVCGALYGPIRGFDGEAGRALRYGSAELAALPPIPADVPIYTLAGRATLAVPGSGWFGFVGSTESVDVGDLIVTTGSALPDVATTGSYDISCAYRLWVLPELGHTIRFAIGVLDPEDQTQHAFHAFGGACFHNGLFRSIEITNEVMLVTQEHIEAQTRQSAFVMEDGAGLIRGVAFSSPSGNILCEFNHLDRWFSVTCWIDEKDFTVPQSELEGGCYGPSDPPPSDSDEVALGSYGDGTVAVKWASCRHDTPEVGYLDPAVFGRWAPADANWIESKALFPVTVPVLEYGQSLRAGSLTCSSAQSGVTCREADGTGFTLSRKGLVRH